MNDVLTGTSYAGATDISSKSKAKNRGANKNRGAKKKGFCPPGQAKKPGRGSAFNC